MNSRVVVCGVGMVPFGKPGSSESYELMGANAARAALADAGLTYQQVQQAYVGYVYGDSCSGQAALYRVGLSAVPIVNVNNNCATGSTALYLARQAVAQGAVECVLALGFEQMRRGAITAQHEDRPDPSQRLFDSMRVIQGFELETPVAAQIFGGAGRMHMRLYGTRPETFARIAVKARGHAAYNPYALFRTPVTLEEVLASPTVFEPLTRLQCCPPTCGAAAAVVCSEAFARRNGLDRSVVIAAQTMTTDGNSSFDEDDMRRLAGYDMARRAAIRAYEQAAVGPDEIAVAELHDCFTSNELISYEALGFVAEGEAEKFVLDGNNTYGGQVVVNPSGGLLSKGHPLGATGLAQCAELTWQLRGQADRRQVEGARLALQHNLGLGGACVVTLYARGL
ncbi:lipid-transfer protein [Bradyrhizobium tropiciagri]|uniref:lipid-transfer protein n=1 Tax=Bradyrhizobium tropiciagri TaxID=312253 RepID=UPI001BA83892|nr:lipid-transfer protein [Bradyrhizobium tropiciagri]MBR0899119.1 lipid-transfer protein [Bradyrhizobium tropiciagri]